MNALTLRTEIEKWPLTKPFRITGYTFDAVNVLVVSIAKDGHVGRGEAAGVYYKDDTPASMARQIESVRPTIEVGIDRDALQQLLPPGGARNAVDCALWDLEAKLAREPVWRLAGLDAPRRLLTTFGWGADTPENMAAAASAHEDTRAIKLKLTGEPVDAARVRAVRAARPDVWLAIDANQGFTRTFLERLMPVLVEARVSLIEQPFRLDEDELLDGFQSPIPIAADESVQSSKEIPALVGRFNIINIKLDKCGGLSEALTMVRQARDLGLSSMIGNMLGTSLAMAPAFLIGQHCQVVDLDGPIVLKMDRQPAMDYRDGMLTCPNGLWGDG